jgi:hypothetical protein
MASRIIRRPDPPQSALSRVGQIWVIESLAERHTGIAIRNHLLDLFIPLERAPAVVYRDVGGSEELFAALAELRADVERTGRYPILDIECHGNRAGLGLRDGSLVTWVELKPYLQAINLVSRFNLVVLMSCCSGAWYASEERLEEPASFLAYLGPITPVDDLPMQRATMAFFTRLFAERDVSAAIQALHAAEPTFPIVYETAIGVFRDVGVGYIRSHSTPDGIRERAQRQRDRLAVQGRVLSLEEAVALVKYAEPEAFKRFVRSYFALDQFPENAARFPIDYQELWDAAWEPQKGDTQG